MARKDFDEYLSVITRQYLELNDVLAEMSKEVSENIIEPERLEQLKATIAPVKQSFDTLNYIRYLLDKPTRKSKHEWYNKQNKSVIRSTQHVDKESTCKRNKEIIDNLSNCI